MRTTDAARDVDAIRAALGQQKISWYGFSYGTYFGATYATLFPNRVKRMVLDGNVNPKTVWYEAQLEQDKAFERNIRAWFGWMAKYDSVYHLGTTEKAVRAKYYAALEGAKKSPIGGEIGPAELTDIVLSVLQHRLLHPVRRGAVGVGQRQGPVGPARLAQHRRPGQRLRRLPRRPGGGRPLAPQLGQVAPRRGEALPAGLQV